jgi:hypothetical protein
MSTASLYPFRGAPSAEIRRRRHKHPSHSSWQPSGDTLALHRHFEGSPLAGASQLHEPSKRQSSSRGGSLCPGSALAGAFLLTSSVAVGRCFLKFGNLIRRCHFAETTAL